MVWRSRCFRWASAGCIVAAAVACGGKSENQSGRQNPASGGSAGSTRGGSGGAADAQPDGCNYNGVRYAPGETFGACDECECGVGSGIVCNPKLCSSDAGSPGNSAGSSSAGAANGGTFGNIAGSTGLAGTAGPGGSGGSGAAVAPKCQYVKVDSFCVVGTPSGDGQDFAVGMPLIVSRRPGGCLSSSCTKFGEPSCNVIGSDQNFSVSGTVCLVTQGDACTDDCAGPGDALCELGPLEAGDYTISLGGVGARSITFTVPSHVKDADRCVQVEP